FLNSWVVLTSGTDRGTVWRFLDILLDTEFDEHPTHILVNPDEPDFSRSFAVLVNAVNRNCGYVETGHPRHCGFGVRPQEYPRIGQGLGRRYTRLQGCPHARRRNGGQQP